MRENDPMQTLKEIKLDRRYEVLTIAPEGLGYGEGSISVLDRLDDRDDPLNQTDLDIIEGLVYSPEIVVPIGCDSDGRKIDDDGCGDGRQATIIESCGKQFSKSLHRTKVFGGGAVMGFAGLIGTGRQFGESVNSAMGESMTALKSAGLEFGTHTADHRGDDESGCGAIDKAPIILQNSLKYQDSISETIRALAGPNGQDHELDAMIDATFENTKEFMSLDPQSHDTYNGRKVVERARVVNKELTGQHREVRVVLNADIEDRTIDQGYIREATDGVCQIFAIDVPRMKKISKNILKSEDEQKQAFVSMIVYSLATAATLTKGDLPVDIVYVNNPYIFADISINACDYALAS